MKNEERRRTEPGTCFPWSAMYQYRYMARLNGKRIPGPGSRVTGTGKCPSFFLLRILEGYFNISGILIKRDTITVFLDGLAEY